MKAVKTDQTLYIKAAVDPVSINDYTSCYFYQLMVATSE